MILDRVDRLILRHLAANPRASYQGMASLTGKSHPAVSARVLRLVDAGILRIGGRVHPAVRGLPVTAELLVDAEVSRVRELLGFDEELRVARVGDSSLVRAQFPGTTAIAETAKRLHPAGQVQVFTAASGGLPPLLHIELDSLDHELMRHLVADPRIPYTTLSRQVGLPRPAVHTRVRRLLDSHALILHAAPTLPHPVNRISLRAHTPINTALGMRSPGLLHVEIGTGCADLVAYTSAPAPTQQQLCARLRSLGEVTTRPLAYPVGPLLWPTDT